MRLTLYAPLSNLSRNKAVSHTLITRCDQFNLALSNGSHTFPGGYPLYFVMADGEALAFSVAGLPDVAPLIRDAIIAGPNTGNDDWRVVAVSVNYEDNELTCVHTGRKIECAYPPDDAPALDTFTRHYLIAALWSSSVSNEEGTGEPLDNHFDIDDIGPNFVNSAISDCRDFQNWNRALLVQAYAFYDENGNSAHPDAGSPEACAGHDFWLTRNGHGAGFWDRGMPGTLGKELSDAAHRQGGSDIDQYDMIDPTAGGAIVNEEEEN